MILSKGNIPFPYNGKIYHIGDRVRVMSGDDYSGLVGVITEIVDGDDKDTENETPDVYCCFDEPVDPDIIKELEERFSDLYNEPKTIDDIILDSVIMDPDTLELLPD